MTNHSWRSSGAQFREASSLACKLTKAERKKYDLWGAIQRCANTSSFSPRGCFEAEISQQIATDCGYEPDSGFYVPVDILANRTHFAGTGGMSGSQTGDDVISTDVSANYLEALAPSSVSAQVGIPTITGLSGETKITFEDSLQTAEWLDEDEAATSADTSTDHVAVTPRECVSMTTYSKKLLVQASSSLQARFNRQLTRAIGVAVDAAIINGDGDSKPTGIYQTSGIGTTTIASAGSPTHAEIVAFETDLTTANVPLNGCHYLVHPTVYGTMKTTKRDSGSGIFLIEDGMTNGYPVIPTNQMPANGILAGNFAEGAAVAQFGPEAIQITVDGFSLAEERKVRLVAVAMLDTACGIPAHFSKNS